MSEQCCPKCERPLMAEAPKRWACADGHRYEVGGGEPEIILTVIAPAGQATASVTYAGNGRTWRTCIGFDDITEVSGPPSMRGA